MLPRSHGPLLVFFANCNDPAREEEFNRWFDTVHIPDAMRTPGMVEGQRYTCVHLRLGKVQYMAAYTLDTSDFPKLASDLRTVREAEAARGQWSQLIEVPVGGVFAPLGKSQENTAARRRPTGMLVVVSNCADPAREAEFHRWYDTVHLPHVLGVSGVLSAQRYKCVHQRYGQSGFMAVYDVAVDDFQRLDQDLHRLIQEEKARGQRPVPELNAVVLSGVYAPLGGKLRRPA
ncbi:MAG: hypothetical protein Q7T26_01565 [Dehalococcoidia bacterium]|nr:hypothetical protein [Dehalococcoidia bacterium]